MTDTDKPDDLGAPVTVEGKRAVVVGGTSGIGRGIARAFAADGADVVASSRTPERVEETAEGLRELGATTAEATCDVTDRESLRELREAAVDAMGGVDVLVNSPSAIARQRLADVSEEEWQHVLDVQLDGVYRTIQEVGGAIDEGSVINIGSLSSVLAISEVAPYSAAKGGVDALTRAAAKEFAPEVRVNAIRPGFILTEQTADAYAEGTQRYADVTDRAMIPRMGEPADVAGAAVYLASDAAGYVTGQILTVDGGFTDAGLD